jgi:hypothetical protein
MEMIDAAILPAIQSAAKVFLYGPFGAGKTTLAVERVRWLLRQERVRGDSILVLVPQRTLAEPFYAALRGADTRPGPPVTITTFASLAQQSVERYWPLLAPTAGFDDPMREPTFLSLETSQFHMAQLVDAAIDQGEFDALRLDRSRVITQVLDNLNKAALLDMEIDAAYRRLELAVPLSEQRTARLNALAAAERISKEFRALCLRETLLDFSLQVTLFNRHVMKNDWSRTHLLRSHRHLVFDNAEEDTPSAHMLVHQWLDDRTAALDSALIVSDDDAGYRTFLGADPQGTAGLAAKCDRRIHLPSSFIMSPAVADLVPQIMRAVNPRLARTSGAQLGIQEDQVVDAPIDMPVTPAIHSAAFQKQHFAEDDRVDPDGGHQGSPFAVPDPFRFYPQMLRWTAREIHRLISEEGIAPGSIAVMAPFVSDALRFSLQTALEEYGIELTTHRPSRPLEAEPAARTLFTLAKLAHPHWGLLPPAPDVSQALAIAMPRLDPVRAQLLTEIVYPPRRRANELGAFAALNEGMRERITYAAGEDFDRLRAWIYTYRAAAEETPLDQFFARLFGELLSQPNYGFHEDRDAARVASQLVQSARRFRWALENEPWRREAVTPGAGAGRSDGGPSITALTTLGRSYLQLAESGAVGALFVPGWRMAEDAVFLAPAYTFLLRNKPVDVQFWLDIGASGWWERLYQPLTHPFVLSHRWPADEPWTDAEEYFRRQDILRRLLLGLIRRTRRSIYLAVSDFSESGYEQRGALLTLINRLLVQREV